MTVDKSVMDLEAAAPAAASTSTAAPAAPMTRAEWFARNTDKLIQSVMTGVLVVGVLVLAAVSPVFRSSENMLNILSSSAIIGVVAVGMLFMIITGGFDLSVGAVGAAAGCVAAQISIEHG